jgi:hypothetical protein
MKIFITTKFYYKCNNKTIIVIYCTSFIRHAFFRAGRAQKCSDPVATTHYESLPTLKI